MEFLIEIDRLVQLLESPIFTCRSIYPQVKCVCNELVINLRALPNVTDVRLELLEIPHNQHLVQALYGLLMLLPQTEAFHMLQRRLNCIPTFHLQNGFPPG